MSQIPDLKKKIDWAPALFLTLTPILAIILTGLYLYLYEFSWWMVAIFVSFYSATALSVTAGYHRMWSHKAYKGNTFIRLMYALFGAASFQNSIYKWSVDHRLHHRYVDTDYDPYSINKGFFYAHMGWMYAKEDRHPKAEAYGRDLEQDKIVMWQHNNYLPIAIFMGFFVPTILGALAGSALGGLAIGGLLRIVALHHGTFLINSACHWWGHQPYTEDNTARDNLVLAFLTFGEGYHNFHHLFASDYRNGIRWYHWDPTKWLIQLNRSLGWARNLHKTPDDKILQARLSMDAKRITSLVHDKNDFSWEETLELLKTKLSEAQIRFQELKVEYRRLKSEKQAASKERLELMKRELLTARQELKESWRQWRSFKTSVYQLA